jgi:hypothetical protein
MALLADLQPPGSIRQSAKAQVTTDVSTTTLEPTYDPLTGCSLTITVPDPCILICLFTTTCAGSNNGSRAYFRILVDGVFLRGCAHRCTAINAVVPLMMVAQKSVTAGDHTVSVAYATSLGTIYVRPLTSPFSDREHATLLVREIVV